MSHAPFTLAMIRRATAARFDVDAEDLRGPSRVRSLAVARHVAIWLARRLTSLSMLQISTQFGDRDHTTIVYAVRAVDARRARDTKFAAVLDDLEHELRTVLERRASERAWRAAVREAARQAVSEAAQTALARVRQEAERDPMGVLEKLGRIETLPAPAGGFEDEDATRL